MPLCGLPVAFHRVTERCSCVCMHILLVTGKVMCMNTAAQAYCEGEALVGLLSGCACWMQATLLSCWAEQACWLASFHLQQCCHDIFASLWTCAQNQSRASAQAQMICVTKSHLFLIKRGSLDLIWVPVLQGRHQAHLGQINDSSEVYPRGNSIAKNIGVTDDWRLRHNESGCSH